MPRTLSKADLANALEDVKVTTSYGDRVTAAAAKRIVDKIFSTITENLQSVDDKVVINGFGTFVVRKRIARDGRNPQTGEKIKLPAGKRIKFKPGSKLRM